MNSDVLTGKALAVLATGERSVLLAAVNRAVVFAKLSPYQKLEVVEALREGGHSVRQTDCQENPISARVLTSLRWSGRFFG